LIWDDTRDYESGVDRGVFYPLNGSGEAWSGLISVTGSPSESDQKSVYLDGKKILQKRRPGHFSGMIESISYPFSFYKDVVMQRITKPFGMSYRVQTKKGYKIHLVYNVLVGPAPKLYQQQGVDFHRWSFTTKPLPIPEVGFSAHLVVDSTEAYSWTLTALETILYGDDAETSRLPSPQEVMDIFEENSILRIIDHGDGTWTAIGPDSAIQMLDSTTFEITWPSAVYIDAVSYTIHSL